MRGDRPLRESIHVDQVRHQAADHGQRGLVTGQYRVESPGLGAQGDDQATAGVAGLAGRHQQIFGSKRCREGQPQREQSNAAAGYCVAVVHPKT